MQVFEILSRRINAGVEWALFALGLGMAAVVAVQVFSRYVLNHSLFWSEELARYLLVWLTFLGATAAYHRGVHPGVDLLWERLPPRVRHGASVIVHAAGLLLFGIMVVYGCRFAWFVRLQISPALSLPKWALFSIIPASGVIFMAHALRFLSYDLKKSAGG